MARAVNFGKDASMRLLGAVTGTAAAVIWSLGLAIYQPLMEPSGYWTDTITGRAYPNLGSNNTYWPRDVRQLAILVAMGGVLLILGVTRRRLLVAAAGTITWLAGDLVLDRLDVHGATVGAILAAAGVLWVAVVAVAGTFSPPGDVLGLRYLAATAIAILAPAAMLVTTPWDEPVTDPAQVRMDDALTILQVVLAVLAVTVAIGLARPAGRPLLLGTLAVASAAGIAVMAKWPNESPALLAGLLLTVAVTLAVSAARGLDATRLAMVGVTAVGVSIPLLFALAVGSMVVGTAMTSLAGNPAINAADSDLSTAFIGLVAGIAIGLLSHLFARDRPAASASSSPAGEPTAGMA